MVSVKEHEKRKEVLLVTYLRFFHSSVELYPKTHMSNTLLRRNGQLLRPLHYLLYKVLIKVINRSFLYIIYNNAENPPNCKKNRYGSFMENVYPGRSYIIIGVSYSTLYQPSWNIPIFPIHWEEIMCHTYYSACTNFQFVLL